MQSKIYFLTFLGIFITAISLGQSNELRAVLIEADLAIRKLETLSYSIYFEMKLLSEEDTFKTVANCQLKKTPEDILEAYHRLVIPKQHYAQIYNGVDFIKLNLKDSSSLIVNEEIEQEYHDPNDLLRYDLFDDRFFTESVGKIPNSTYTLKEGVVHNEPCHRIFIQTTQGESTNVNISFWVRKKDYVLVAYQEDLDIEGEHQYKRYVLSNIIFNPNFKEQLFDSDYNVLDASKVKHWQPAPEIIPLALGTTAPSFELPSIQDQIIHLKAKKGKIILLDFWYCSCHHCVKAMPILQKIADEFDPAIVEVIGVNISDPKEKIIPFLERRKISYTNVYTAKELSKVYAVSAYPTLYIIDANGKIHYVHEGFFEKKFYTAVTNAIKTAIKASKNSIKND